MLNYDNILSLMTKHFPRWMDIRKRVQTSNGGKYLQSIANEVASIQEAIDEYKKEFFIENYEGKYEDIPYCVYYIEIGDIPSASINFLDEPYKNFMEAMSEKEFYSSHNTYYYEDNKILFKSSDVINHNGAIRYNYDDVEYTPLIHEYYLWNIYDEFAAFVGLTRFVGENNEELTNRILHVFEQRPNSTEEGLQNAIIVDTLDFILDEYPNTSLEDIRKKIIIERPSPDNLILKYDEFSTLLDKLAEINRDVYRTKTWDKDLWQFELAGNSYLPHTWDIVLSAYANGIGFKDDLKASLIDGNNNNLEATIEVYTQDKDTLNTYLQNKSVTKNIEYDIEQRDVVSADVSYAISASRPVRINDDINNIKFIINSGTDDEKNFLLSKIISDNIDDIDVSYDGIYYSASIEHFIVRQGETQPPDVAISEPDSINVTYTDKEKSVTRAFDSTESIIFAFDEFGALSNISNDHQFARIIFSLSDNCAVKSISLNDVTIDCTYYTRNEDGLYITAPNHDKITFENNKLSVAIECEPILIQSANDDSTPENTNDITYTCSIESIEFYASEYTAYASHSDLPDDTANLNIWNKYNHQSREKSTYAFEISYEQLIQNNNLDNIHISIVGADGSNLDFTPVFVTDKNGTNEYHQSYEHDGVFEYLYFYPKNSIRYLSHNKITVTDVDTNGVQIVNNFTPAVSLSTELIYNITPSDTALVYFGDAKNKRQWAFGNDTLSIHLTDNSQLVRSTITKHYNESITLNSTEKDFSEYLLSKQYISSYSDDYSVVGDYTDGVHFEKSNDDGHWKIAINIADLYQLVPHTTDTYTKKNTTIPPIKKVIDGDTYTEYIPDYDDSKDIIAVDLRSPQFSYTNIGNNVTFYKIPYYQSKAAIKCGYYYIGNKEYYLFGNQDDKNSENHGSVEIDYNNTYLENGKIVLNKTNVNYIKNSRMDCNDDIESIYYLDTTKYSEKITYNHLGSLSTCNNLYGKWHVFGADLLLHNYGENNKDTGIRIRPRFDNAYTYLNITSTPNNNYYISMYIHGDLNAKIVREHKYEDIYDDSSEYVAFDDSVNTEHVVDFKYDDYSYCEYYQEDGYDYYLVVYCPNSMSSDTLFFDDIIMIDSDDKALATHQKNISALGISIAEQTIDNDYSTRLYFDSKYASCENCEIDDEGLLRNSPFVNWGLTSIMSLSTADDFHNNLTQIDHVIIDDTYNYLYTASTPGSIITSAISIDNPATIKDIVVELNDIPFNNMSNFTVNLYTSDTKNGTYVPIGSSVNMQYDEKSHTGCNIGNFNCRDLIRNYIKLYIAIGKNTILGDISLYAKYRSDEDNAPIETISSGGVMLTSILDAHYIGQYAIDSVNFVGDCKEFAIHMRAYAGESEWTDWKQLDINNDGTVKDSSTPLFTNAKFFQARVTLLEKESSVRINYIDLRKVG